jgi:vacuolar-type H+-ATPase subunit I/STV1
MNTNNLGLHYQYDYALPGGIRHPRLIEVINEKLDLINRLIDLGESVGQEERNTIKELRLIQLNSIKEIITSVESDIKTEAEKVVEDETFNEDYINTLTDLQKQMEELFKSLDKKGAN